MVSSGNEARLTSQVIQPIGFGVGCPFFFTVSELRKMVGVAPRFKAERIHRT
jgi:hypothetical protein